MEKTIVGESFSGRGGHRVVAMNGVAYMVGGFAGAAVSDEVWTSSTGTSWTKITNDADVARWLPGLAVVDDKLWVAGGANATFAVTNDVLWSSDGVTWNDAADAPPFTERWAHRLLPLNGRIHVVAGSLDLASFYLIGDVWSYAPTDAWRQAYRRPIKL